MSTIDIKALIQRQAEVEGPISRAISNLKKVGEDNLTQRRVQGRLDALRQNWKLYQDNHARILDIRETTASKAVQAFLAESDYFAKGHVEIVEETFLDAQEFMETRLDKFHANDPASGAAMADRSIAQQPGTTHSHRLPKIDLPKFSGEPREWLSFRDLFCALVGSNSNITNVEKLHYLKTSVSGAAAQRIESISLSHENFAATWDYLTALYDDKRLLVNTAMKDFMDTRPVTRSSGTDLARFNGEITRAITALETLGQYTQHCDAFVVYIVVSKLDANTVREWENSLGLTQLLPTWQKLLKFLEIRARSLQAFERAKPQSLSTTSISKQTNLHKKNTVLAAAVTATEHATSPHPKPHSGPRDQSCLSCKENHYIAACPTFRTKPLNERKDFVTTKNLCFNCLGAHRIKDCRTSKRCQTCQGHHHTLLHNPSRVEANRAAPPTNTSQINTPAVSSHTARPTIIPRTPVLLATVLVTVSHPETGETLKVRALLDQGSESSFITESLAQQLRLPRRHATVPVIGVGAQQTGVTRGLASLVLRSHVDPSFSCQSDALVLPRLTSFLPSFRLLVKDWPHLNGLALADPSFTHPSEINLIMGADIYSHVILDGIRRGGPKTPIAQETRFGWVLSGSVAMENTEPHRAPIQGFQCSLDYELNDMVQRFWNQEEINKPTKLTPDDEKCEIHFRNTVSRDDSGRYIVRLPFKNVDVVLGDSRSRASQMLSRMEKRFATNPTLRLAYSSFLREYSELGHMQLAQPAPTDASCGFYLPHHGVVRESSSTTKLRVVFNGSQKTDRGLSLNENLLVGPKILNDLSDVLLRWRRHPIAFSADIAKMYRQIIVHESDRDWQRILWREDPTSSIDEYRLCTVTYGLACAPFLAIRVLHQLVADEGDAFPVARRAILEETYVDDILSGAENTSDGREKMFQLTQLLKAGGFELQKWTASQPELLLNIPPASRETANQLPLDQNPVFRALGLMWRPDIDAFAFVPQISADLPPTERKVLSQVAQLFDPLGWLAPVTIRAKIFLQELWTLGLEWDEPLSEALATRWNIFMQQLHGATNIVIPRWLGLSATSLGLEIHGFSDASEDAMAAVVYMRVYSDYDSVTVTLVCAKTKVALLKKLTIPRLELCGALLLVRLIRDVEKTLKLDNIPTHLWTDSTTALAWIKSHPSLRKEFVRNRVTEIQELSNARWHHIAGSENPADIASRGASPEQVCSSTLWRSGPEWLSKPSVWWPSSSATPDPDIDLEERKTVRANFSNSDPKPMWDLVERFSRLSQLLRVTALCVRTIHAWRARCKHSTTTSRNTFISTEETNNAMLFWVQATQQSYFSNDFRQIKNGLAFSRGHPLARLAPFIDANNLLRVGGRLQHSHLSYDEQHPFILPRESSLTSLVITHYHILTLHGGAQLTLASIRQRFWILGGRIPIRAHIYRCVVCARQRATLSTQLMGQLPHTRVTRSRPFLHTGTDYAGPFTIRAHRGRTTKTYKGYIIIFICFSTSAVHLELVSDYSADGFIAAYKRFTGRRGICASLRSDCGRNLIGADAELRRLLGQASNEATYLAKILATHGTQWLFNPPSAPHFGGKWEAGVKSVKFHLKRVIGESTLTFEEFSTLLTQVEATLNSRPLCALSDDSSDLSTLTPRHFLIGTALNTVPEPSLESLPVNRLSRWQHGRQMLEHFWRRWSREYLQSLQPLSKWQTRKKNIKIGAIVLLKDENRPPTVWPLARVLEVHPGADGAVRAVTVKTQSTTLKRPIAKLCVLPIDDDS